MTTLTAARIAARTAILGAACLLPAMPLPGLAAAAYPEKTLRIVAPFPPGGGVDLVARLIAQSLAEGFMQPVIVDNRPGATGRIGTELVARAAPDGYSLLLGSVGANAIIPAAHRNLPYDAINDFAAISLVASAPYVLVVHPSLPAKTLPELIALARGKPGQLAYSSSGNLSGAHLSGELINLLARVSMLHVPYKGAAPAMNDLLGGQVAMTFAAIPGTVPHVQAGRLRALGVTGARRAQALPQVPAIGEVLKGYEVTQWYGLFAPAATPREIVNRLHAETVRALERPEVRRRLIDIGTDPVGGTPDQLAAQVKSEIARWGELIRKAGIKPD
jgi:tripartite-type tricarboxylate transporter receptor subunit TctC